MKATKLMALGLVGLTTLGLASTANAEEATESSVNTQASVTFTIADLSGDQDGPGGKPVAPDNPVVETPNTVGGWKLSVPQFLYFEGTDKTVGEKGPIYNPERKDNNYVGKNLKDQDGNTIPFFLRINKAVEKQGKQGDYEIKVSRSTFKIDNGVVLDVDDTSYITLPQGKADTTEDSVISNWQQKLVDAQIPKGDVGATLGNVTLKDGAAIDATRGFITFEPGDIKLHIGPNSNSLKTVTNQTTVSTVLTWTLTSQVSE